jgi:hypothetical protein
MMQHGYLPYPNQQQPQQHQQQHQQQQAGGYQVFYSVIKRLFTLF